MSGDPLSGHRRRGPAGILRRLLLTYRYLGWRTLLVRVLLAPLRATPIARSEFAHRFMPTPESEFDRRVAEGWYRRNGRPVVVVIPSYRDAREVADLVRSIRRTTPRRLVRIVVADDASGPDHLAALCSIDGIEVVAGKENRGFSANVNRGLAAAGGEHDVVVLNSDMVARPGWLAALQHAASCNEGVGIVGPRLLYPDGRIQFGGTQRGGAGASEWFDHRFRFLDGGYGPAGISGDVLAVTGACMYLRRELLAVLGPLDEGYPMAYEDVDYCLRAWEAGWRVYYAGAASLTHLESTTRGSEVNERELVSQRRFWERWGTWLNERDVRTPDGHLRVVYVTEDTGVGGGHRDIFEHLNGLAERGHDVALYSLAGRPEWFELSERVPVHSFEDFAALEAALAPIDAIKIATWWLTGPTVWRASVRRGIPVFFVQDIETSYYPDDERRRNEVIAGYKPEFTYMTISEWNRERLRELRLEAELIPPGIDLENFRPRPEIERRGDALLAVGRSNPLKNFPLTRAAWLRLPEPRPELVLFGIEPELADTSGMRYIVKPSDDEVAQLMAQCGIFVQTSTHEGFCLPPLEAMATGAAIVCTDAHGNRDFCRDGENCLVPEGTEEAVTAALARLLGDPALRERFGRAGIETAAEYSWPRRIDALEAFLTAAAEPRTVTPASGAVPELKRDAR